MPYPEHDKLERQVHGLEAHGVPWKVQNESNVQLGPFLEWLMNQVEFANWQYSCLDCGAIQEGPDCHNCGGSSGCEQELIPVRHTVTDWLALYYNVDIAKLNEEKAEILAELRREKV